VQKAGNFEFDVGNNHYIKDHEVSSKDQNDLRTVINGQISIPIYRGKMPEE
jgi:hypothetical protein